MIKFFASLAFASLNLFLFGQTIQKELDYANPEPPVAKDKVVTVSIDLSGLENVDVEKGIYKVVQIDNFCDFF